MNRHVLLPAARIPAARFSCSVLLVLSALSACGDGATEPTSRPPQPTKLFVEPLTATDLIASSQEWVQLAVRVFEYGGKPRPNMRVYWAAGSPTVDLTLTLDGAPTRVGLMTSTDSDGNAVVWVRHTEFGKVPMTAVLMDAAAPTVTFRVTRNEPLCQPAVRPAVQSATRSAQIYHEAGNSYPSGPSRYVLFDDGTFGLQILHDFQSFEYFGTYCRRDSVYYFAFDDASWKASGLIDGEKLTVKYNSDALESEALVNAVYVRQPWPADTPRFPALTRPGQVYNEVGNVYAWASREALVSRYVLYDDGKFALQFARIGVPISEYTGAYSVTSDGYAFAFDEPDWIATATVEGDKLFVEYNADASLSDFMDAVYVRQAAP